MNFIFLLRLRADLANQIRAMFLNWTLMKCSQIEGKIFTFENFVIFLGHNNLVKVFHRVSRPTLGNISFAHVKNLRWCVRFRVGCLWLLSV